MARAGAEHLAVHELSVHSLAYFYNWCFAQVGTRYSFKWDGDMVLTTEGEASLADLAWQVGDVQAVIRVPRHALYLDSTRPERGWLDLGLRNAEEWGFPIGPDFVFTKAFEWEVRTTPPPVAHDRAAVRAVRGAEVPRRRRVRPLDRPGVVRDELPQQAQAPRVGGLHRPAARARRACRRAPRSRRPPACTWSTTSPAPGCPQAPRPLEVGTVVASDDQR